MKKILRARKGGFTLVELLIVIIIIAILAGMMLLTTGAATDGAEASKMVNNLRSYKSAALLYYVDHGLVWPMAAAGNEQQMANSLEPYMDRSIDVDKYGPSTVTHGERVFIGVVDSAVFTDKPGVPAKLEGMALDSGLYNAGGTKFTAGDAATGVFMNMR